MKAQKGSNKKAKVAATPDPSAASKTGEEIAPIHKPLAGPRITSIKNNDKKPTWDGEVVITGKSTKRVNNENFMTGYLGLPSELHLCNLAFSQ